MGTESSFAVIVEFDGVQKVGSMAQALATYKKVPLQDATHQARNCWGIVEENISEEEAKRLAGCLRDAEIKSRVIPQTKAVLVPKLIQLIHVSIEESSVTGKDISGAPHVIPWNKIRVISAAGLKSTTTKTIKEKQGPSNTQRATRMGLMLATGLPLPIGGRKKETEKKMSQSDTYFSFTLLTGSPLAHFHIPAENINYSYLKEKKLYNVMGNFKLVLADMVRRAPQAVESKGSRILLSNQPVMGMGYDSYQDVERECRWLLIASSE